MSADQVLEQWADGEAYDSFMGRWSGLVAEQFVHWLDLPAEQAWLEVGCGTGALSGAVLRQGAPQALLGFDRSAEYVERARTRLPDPRARFEVGEATALPVQDGGADAAVSGLVLNFVAEPQAMLLEMVRAVRPGGTVALYVWDYSRGMALLRRFWDAAITLDPRALELDEGYRFHICRPSPLERALQAAGLRRVEIAPLEIDTPFAGFEALWAPFLTGQGPAPGYVQSLTDAERDRLRERLRKDLAGVTNGMVHLRARAWAARGIA